MNTSQMLFIPHPIKKTENVLTKEMSALTKRSMESCCHQREAKVTVETEDGFNILSMS
jgi:hypothetical protein